jgi:hypothetical protein
MKFGENMIDQNDRVNESDNDPPQQVSEEDVLIAISFLSARLHLAELECWKTNDDGISVFAELPVAGSTSLPIVIALSSEAVLTIVNWAQWVDRMAM